MLLASLLACSCAAAAHAADDARRAAQHAVRRVLGREPQAQPDHRDASRAIRVTTPSCRISCRPSTRSSDARSSRSTSTARAPSAPTGLTGQDRLSYDIFTLNRESALEEFKFPDRLLPINQFYNFANFFAQLGSGTSAQPFVTVKDYDDWLTRAAQRPVIFDQAIVNMREGMKAGIVAAARAHGEGAAAARRQRRRRSREEHLLGSHPEHAEGFLRRRSRAPDDAFRNLITTQLNPAYRGCASSSRTNTCRSRATRSAWARCPTAPPGTNTMCATTPCGR